MSSRRIVILFIAALVVIALATWLSLHRQSDRAAAAGRALLPDIKKELNDVTEVRLAKAHGTRTTLEKAGSDWMVTERNFMADGGRVRKLLLDVAALTIVEEKTSDPERYAAVGVEDIAPPDLSKPPPLPAENKEPYDFDAPVTGTRLDIVTPAKTWSLIAGKSSGGKSGFVRVAGAKQSFLATPKLDLETEPQRWLDHTVVNVPEARIQSVAIQPAEGPGYTVSREKREQENFAVADIPKTRKLSYEGVANALARGLESLSFDDVRQKSVAAEASPAKTIERSRATYRTFDGLTVEVAGRKESSPGLKKDDPKIEKFFITLSAASTDKATQPEAEKLRARAAGREFEISSYKYEGMFKPLDDLLEAPSTHSGS